MDELSTNATTNLVPTQQLRIMQMIAAALVLGVVSFGAIVLFLVMVQNHGRALGTATGVLTWISVVMLLAAVPISIVVPRIILQRGVTDVISGRWQAPPQANLPFAMDTISGKLLGVWLSATIVGLVVLEAVGFIGNIAYLLEGRLLALGVVGAAVVLMIARFPTEARVRAWLLQQAEAIEQVRQQRTA